MIKLITNNPNRFQDLTHYSIVPLKELVEYMELNLEFGLDSETRGLDCHTKELVCIQIGDDKVQYVIDCESVDIVPLKELLEKKTLIGQNLKFDLQFLYKKGIYSSKIYDTFVAEKVLYCGLDYMSADLGNLILRYTGVSIDKSVRIDIPKEGLTLRVIKYAAADIQYLQEIKAKQIKDAEEKDLIGVFNLEFGFTPCLAYIEYCGFKLNREKWIQKMQQDFARKTKLLQKLDEFIMQNHPALVETQVNMFRDVKPILNWDSPKQVVDFFESLGMDCSVVVKGVKKKSVESTNIVKYEKEYPIVHTYLEYKGEEKNVTTYGDNVLQQINKNTGRLHTTFKQILDTGRLSSGGKDKDRGFNLVNFQNIPTTPEERVLDEVYARDCFVAEEGNTLVVADYSGEEQVVLANFSMDKSLLEFYDKGLKDMHCFVAAKMYPELKGLSVEDIKSKHKQKRYNAKTVGFSINYGGEGSTIAAAQGISKAEGDAIYKSYFDAFPGLRAYFDKVKYEGLKKGYIHISPVTQRKSYISFQKEYDFLASLMTESYWRKYRELKEFGGPEFPEKKAQIKQYFYYKGLIERKCLNFPIQGSCADILKIACYYVYSYILKNNLFGIVKIPNIIHDEIVLECPIDMAPQLLKILETSMIKAGQLFCKRVPLGVTALITTVWEK